MSHFFVEVWYGDILLTNNAEENNDEFYWSVLNKQERERSRAFKRKDLQKKYIKTRAVLKEILAGYTNVEPQQLIIETAQYGKPFITADYNLYFNLSHQGNRFAIVVSNTGELGIDIEQCRDRKNFSALVKKCFSETEAQFWSAAPVEQQAQLFYSFWVRKEAFVKAVGRGIALGLNQCVVDPNNQSCFISIPKAYGEPGQWKILNIKLNDDDLCAVVLKSGVDFEFKQTQWHE